MNKVTYRIVRNQMFDTLPLGMVNDHIRLCRQEPRPLTRFEQADEFIRPQGHRLLTQHVFARF